MKMKKLLAAALAATMIFSSMVTSFVASAAQTVGTITAGTVNAVAGETDTVAADINIAFPDGVVAPHNIVTVSLAGYTLESVTAIDVTYAADSASGIVDIDTDGSNLAAGKILFEAPVDNKAPTVLAISFKANFVDADAEDTAVGEYDIVVNGDDMTNLNEEAIGIDAVNGKLIVTAPHVCAPDGEPKKEKVVDATCTTAGSYDLVTYCECGKVLKTESFTVEALGHAWDDGVETKAPDCDDAGVKTYTCGTCGETKTEAIDALGHKDEEIKAVDATCTTPGYTAGVKCSVCDAIITAPTEIPVIPHDFAEGTCTVCGTEDPNYEPPVTEPVLDESITLTTAINVTETINTRVIISKEVAKYADYDLVLTRAKAYSNSGAYDLTEPQEFVYDKGEEITVMADGRGAFLYNELGMYELGIDFDIMIKCYDAEGKYVAYSNVSTTNVGKLAYALYSPANASAKNKNIAIDIARLGDEAQKYMVNGKACGLADVTSPISYFPAGATEGATFDASKLNTTNSSTSVVSGVTITPAVNLAGNPCLRFLIAGTGTTYAQDTLSLEITYINGKNGKDCSVTIPGSDLQVVGTAGSTSVRYANLFGAIALYDGNVTVKATLKSGTTVLATNEYSVESYVNANYNNARMGAVLKAVANLGTSARAYFGM